MLVDYEVAVILEVEIDTVIEAGEGGVGGSHDEVGLGEPIEGEEAEDWRGAGEEKERFEIHV